MDSSTIIRVQNQTLDIASVDPTYLPFGETMHLLAKVPILLTHTTTIISGFVSHNYNSAYNNLALKCDSTYLPTAMRLLVQDVDAVTGVVGTNCMYLTGLVLEDIILQVNRKPSRRTTVQLFKRIIVTLRLYSCTVVIQQCMSPANIQI